MGGFFTSLGERGEKLKQLLRYRGLVTSSDIFQSFTRCGNNADCIKIILEIVNEQQADRITEHIFKLCNGHEITLVCSDITYGKIEILYNSINAKDKAKLCEILKTIYEAQQTIQKNFQEQIDKLTQDTETENVKQQEKIDKINEEIKRLQTELGEVENKKDDINRRKDLRENINAKLKYENRSFDEEIQKKSQRIQQLELSNTTTDAADSDEQSRLFNFKPKNFIDSFVSGVSTKEEKAVMEKDIIHRRNIKTIDDLRKEISDLEARIQKNSSKITPELPESSEDDEKMYDAKLSTLNAQIIENEKELKLASHHLATIQTNFDNEVASLTQQRDTSFRNINSGNSSNSSNSSNMVSGGRRTAWCRCPSRRRRHRRRTNKIRKSRKGRKMRRN